MFSCAQYCLAGQFHKAIDCILSSTSAVDFNFYFIFVSSAFALTSKHTHLPESHSYTGCEGTAIHNSMKEQCVYISKHYLLLEYCAHIYFQITFEIVLVSLSPRVA
jgi:hypothetical protein